jgi:hypothetical protein
VDKNTEFYQRIPLWKVNLRPLAKASQQGGGVDVKAGLSDGRKAREQFLGTVVWGQETLSQSGCLH